MINNIIIESGVKPYKNCIMFNKSFDLSKFDHEDKDCTSILISRQNYRKVIFINRSLYFHIKWNILVKNKYKFSKKRKEKKKILFLFEKFSFN